MIRIAIVEDEKEPADQLIRFIRQYEKQAGGEPSFEVRWFSSSWQFLEQYRSDYDILFFDIQMPHLDGMETARRVFAQDKEAIIIFVTGLSQYAINGYEVNALDYVVKPITYPRLADKLDKALARLARRPRHKITLTKENAVLCLNVSDVFYVEVTGHTLAYHTAQGVYTLRGNLSAAEKELQPFGFSRCNKCYLVNLQHVRSIEKNTVQVGSETLAISRGQQKAFMNDFLAYIQKGGILR